MNRKYIVAALSVIAMGCLFLTGCGERVTNVETQPATEAVTEAVTEKIQIETQKPTEPPTEPPTEKVTETEPPTEPDRDLTPEEELAQETPLSAAVTYYANDDINVRETPSTENSDNIISSYDQGQEVSVIAKTPHWYKVQKEDYTGYVYKAGLSETGVEPKSDEEREQAAAAAAAAAPAPEESQQEAAPAAQPVSGYADSFPIQIASDANVRSAAGETAEVIGVLNAGTTATAIGESGEWYQIDYNGTTGFVNKNLVG